MVETTPRGPQAGVFPLNTQEEPPCTRGRGKRLQNGRHAGLPKHDPAYLLSTLLGVKDPPEMCNHKGEERGTNRRWKDYEPPGRESR